MLHFNEDATARVTRSFMATTSVTNRKTERQQRRWEEEEEGIIVNVASLQSEGVVCQGASGPVYLPLRSVLPESSAK